LKLAGNAKRRYRQKSTLGEKSRTARRRKVIELKSPLRQQRVAKGEAGGGEQKRSIFQKRGREPGATNK